MTEFDVKKMVEIRYKNHRGQTTIRRILPFHYWFGKSPWHEGEQWFLDAVDQDKDELRSFAMSCISSWRPVSIGADLIKGK